MFARNKLVLLTSAAAVVGSLSLIGVAQEKAPAGPPRVSSCIVTLIEKARVPAQEAGVLTAIEARDGMQVDADALLAQIDDDQMQLKKKVAEAKYNVARVKASLAIEKAKLDPRIATETAKARAGEVQVAQNDIDRRQIRAPFAGEIVEVFPRRGEWINPGAPVVYLIKLDRLRVEGYLQVADYSPEEIKGRPVTVKVHLERGRVEQFKGKVVFASPLIEGNGEYRIKADVENRRDGDDGPWLLRPGLQPETIIDMTSPQTASIQN